MRMLQCTITTIPRGEVAMLMEVISQGNATQFIDQVIDFALPIAKALRGGAKVATGNRFMGYHEVDITLAQPIIPFPGIQISFELAIPIAEVPTSSKLERLRLLLGAKSEGEAIARALYWFWVAAQLASLARELFIMDHQRGRWEAYVYAPLWDARFQFGY